MEEKEEKQKLIQKYKEAMTYEPCSLGPSLTADVKGTRGPKSKQQTMQRQKVGTSSRYRTQRRNRFWEFIEEREGGDPFENDAVTFELGEMLLMLLAAGGEDNLTDSEDEWDLFHDELEDCYDLDL
ncbi:UNVERIFIED_CONTAM: hypothetical protein K2H54_074914 [Gekko kuhli]